MSDVALTEVTKRFGSDAAVDSVTFTVARGTLAALLGPSGCGKSTTLRLIAGLDAASSGQITIGGHDVTRLPPAGRGVSMVFQSYALFPHLSVAENILFGLKVRKASPSEQKARLDQAADMLGLTKLLDRKPSQLSGGQQQRVALGRAIVAQTPVCLMDEPLSNLDAQLRVEMRREIRDLQQRLGMTMIYVTHDQLEAMTMADQVVLMQAGRIEQDAAPAALYETPATLFAARFIGTPPMNIVAFDTLSAHLPSLSAAVPNGWQSSTLAVGVRPEHVRLSTTGIPAVVSAVEYLGADTLVEARIADTPVIARLAGRASARKGEPVHLQWDHGAMHWFDLSSGRHIP